MNMIGKGARNTFSKKKFVVASLAAAIALAGCSSDNPDKGKKLSTTNVSGVAVDGYLAGASVYVDFNNDGSQSAGEPSALTDKNGYFSTGKDGTDYCAKDASGLASLHCLKASTIKTGDIIRTAGGFDVFTGEPFLGSLAARVSVDEDGVVANQMISPLTSVLVDVENEEDKQTILDALALDVADLDEDFLDDASYDANAVNNATKLHKVVTLLSDAFTEEYDEFGEETSFPDSPNKLIYAALAERLAAGDTLDSATLRDVFDDVQEKIVALFEEDDDDDDDDEDDYDDMPDSVSSSDRDAAIAHAVDIQDLIDNAISSSTPSSDAQARVIGVETVVKKMIDDASDVASAIAEVGDPSSNLYTKIDDALMMGDVDFIALTNVDFTAPNYDDMGVIGGDSFANLSQKQLYVNLDEDGKTGGGYFFFESEQDAPAGELKVCLSYDDGDDDNDEFEETDGVLLKGTWLSIDDSRLILNLAGALSVNLADKGMIDGNLHRYTLSYGGDTRSWTSSDGLLDETLDSNAVMIPSNDDACEDLLDKDDDD